MTPIGDLVSRILAFVLDKRQAPEPTPPVPEDPDLARQAEAWAEPENEAPLFAGDKT